MATALDWIFVADEDPAAALEALAAEIEADAAWIGPWTEVEHAGGGGEELVGERRGAWTLWRLLGEQEVQEPVTLSVGLEPERRAVRWRLTDVGPLCALTGPDGAPKDHPHHERVLDNAERCTRVALAAARRIGARHAAAYSDAGERLLFNAHVVYWSDEEHAAQELARALASSGDPLDGQRGHTWRTEAQRRELDERLARLGTPPAIRAEHVQSVLESGQFDVYRTEAGFAVLEHPWYVNAFVDRFLFAVATAAAHAR